MCIHVQPTVSVYRSSWSFSTRASTNTGESLIGNDYPRQPYTLFLISRMGITMNRGACPFCDQWITMWPRFSYPHEILTNWFMVKGGACSKKPLYAGKTSSKLPGTRLNYTSFLITQISPGGIKENYSPSWNPVHKRHDQIYLPPVKSIFASSSLTCNF